MSEKRNKIDMYHFTISIAGLNVKINTLSPGTYGYCIRYLSSDEPDFEVRVTEEDIHNYILENQLKTSNINELYLETIVVYTKIVDKAVDYGMFLMHGAVIAKDNIAYMFTAPSGTGKTTHIKKWIKNADGVIVLNGDKPLIKVTDSDIIACGTPWNGKERLGRNIMVPLKSIIIIERSNLNSIQEISFSEAYPYLLQEIYLPSDPIKAKKTLNLISRLYGKVSFWKFQCNNLKDDCFQVSYDALVGDKQ